MEPRGTSGNLGEPRRTWNLLSGAWKLLSVEPLCGNTRALKLLGNKARAGDPASFSECSCKNSMFDPHKYLLQTYGGRRTTTATIQIRIQIQVYQQALRTNTIHLCLFLLQNRGSPRASPHSDVAQFFGSSSKSPAPRAPTPGTRPDSPCRASDWSGEAVEPWLGGGSGESKMSFLWFLFRAFLLSRCKMLQK